jgi:hypothetical protein
LLRRDFSVLRRSSLFLTRARKQPGAAKRAKDAPMIWGHHDHAGSRCPFPVVPTGRQGDNDLSIRDRISATMIGALFSDAIWRPG